MPYDNIIDEVQTRNEMTRREAFGEVDDEKVYVELERDKHGDPYVFASYGFQWHHYPSDELDDEFIGGTSQRKTFNRAQSAIWYFEELVDERDLVEELPLSWIEGADQ